MKSLACLCCLLVWVLPAQNAPQGAGPVIPPPNVISTQVDAARLGPLAQDTVIATIDGKKLTSGELQNFVRALPPQMQQNAMQNRKAFVQQFALMRKLAGMAEKDKLDQQTPYKDYLEFNRTNILAQAQLNELPKHLLVMADEQQKYYEDHKDRYTQVKLKVIYIPFSAEPAEGRAGKQPLTEAEAREKTERLVKDLRGGADFVTLVKENSGDATSKAKDGDFGTLSPSDNLPDAIRAVVFRLKAGEVSEPVRQANGYYLFRAEEVTAKPYAEVRDAIYDQIYQERLKIWMDGVNKSLNITYDSETFFSPGSPAATPAPGK